jgi:copper resistance protein C
VNHSAGARISWSHAAALVIGAVVGAALLVPAAAWAHSRLIATNPAASATVTAPLSEVTLTFNEHVHQQFSIVVVHGPGGVSYSNGHVQVIDNVVHQPVYLLKSGSYTVAWRVVSADGHPVEGKFGFTVALPAQLEPSAGPPSPSPSRLALSTEHRSVSWWPWLAGAGVVLVGGVVVGCVVVARFARRGR